MCRLVTKCFKLTTENAIIVTNTNRQVMSQLFETLAVECLKLRVAATLLARLSDVNDIKLSNW